MRLLFAALALLSSTSSAQVTRHQTISALEGGFVGPLEDGDRFGVSAATLGDLDGDGRVEVAVGAYGDDDGRGTIWILSLEADGTVGAERLVRVDGLDPIDLFGVSVATIGDLDGDGLPELAVGADRDDAGGENRGAVWILFLDPSGVRRAQKISATEGGLEDVPADGDLFGHSVAAIGDLDGDGMPDLAVGADDADGGGENRGAIWILFLEADGTVRQSQRISDLEGGFGGTLDDRDLFSQALVGLGDLDGDGIPDLAASATLDDDGGTDIGAVWVLFLRRDGTVRQHRKISATAGGFAGVLEDGDAFGSSLVAPGDLDGDGTSDLIVGAGRDDDGGTDRGAGYILFLRRDGTVRAHQKLSDLEGGNVGVFEDGDQWTPLARVGDLDGDRRADLLIGSRLSSVGGFQRGAARVLFTGFAVDREAMPGPRGSLHLSPNPATSRTSIAFDLEVAGLVHLRVFDVLGREMATVLEGDRPSGAHRVEVDVSGWAPGTYVVRLEGEEVSTVRLVVAR